MNEESARTSSSLHSFLSIFDDLSWRDKAVALEYLRRYEEEQFPTQSQVEGLKKDDASNYNAHSCYICKSLIVKERTTMLTSPSGEELQEVMIQNGEVFLTKATMFKGIHQGCVLVKWVVALLDKALGDLKSDLDSKSVRASSRQQYEGLGANADHLDYLSADASVQVTLELSDICRTARIILEYELDPLLMDKLWDATIDKGKYENDYKGFIGKYRSLIRTSFRIFTLQDDPIATVITTRPITTGMNAEASFELARTWLQQCDTGHELCRKEEGLLPSRVIDIGSRFPIRSVRLYWTEDEERGKYAALSYCWGGPQSFATTRATAQDFTDGVVLLKLPKTLQDAINTTYQLGLRYIWIDCLCIIQDDSEDVAREISRMSEIFSEATVTISAASARSVEDGFLELRKPSLSPSLKVQYESKTGTRGSFYMEQPQQYSPEEDPISLRAWTLQEHVLSQRILMYSTRELWWTCARSSVQNMGLDEGSAARHLFRAGSRFSIDYWRSIVQDYTRRFLTYSSDKLPALAGVAADYSQILGGRYLAGLWEFSLISELLWSSRRSDISRPAVQRAPSWSWAAVDGEISHDWCPLEGAATPLEILYCQVTPVSTSSPFASVDPTRSTLKVHGEIGAFFWSKDRRYIYTVQNVDDQGSPPVTTDVARTQADASELLIENHLGMIPVWALVVTKNPTRGIVLIHVHGDTFRRVGIFYRFWYDAYCPTQREIIKII